MSWTRKFSVKGVKTQSPAQRPVGWAASAGIVRKAYACLHTAVEAPSPGDDAQILTVLGLQRDAGREKGVFSGSGGRGSGGGEERRGLVCFYPQVFCPYLTPSRTTGG